MITTCTFWDDDKRRFVYAIPNIWLAGRTTKYIHHDKASVSDAYYRAIRDWHEQAVMEAEWEAEHA